MAEKVSRTRSMNVMTPYSRGWRGNIKPAQIGHRLGERIINGAIFLQREINKVRGYTPYSQGIRLKQPGGSFAALSLMLVGQSPRPAAD